MVRLPRSGILMLLLTLLTTTAVAFTGSLLSSGQSNQPPPMDDAIQVSADADWDNQQLVVQFDLMDEVYLYQHRFSFGFYDHNGNLIDDFEAFELPPGEPKDDPIFGNVEVYFDALTLLLPLQSVPLTETYLLIDYQGCLDEVLCYPPATKQISFSNPQGTVNTLPATPPSTTPAAPQARDGFISTLGSEDANRFNEWMTDQSLALVVLLFFVGGLLLAFTPCVFPMVPILSGILAGQSHPTASRGFSLSTSYVLGMALPYTAAGMLVGVFGARLNLQYMLQQPAAIITSAVIFVILAASMFGLFQLQLPAALRDKLGQHQPKKRGGLTSAALLGALSALVVSPCVTPILAGALIYVAATGDMATGGLSLFALAMGMGVPLIIFGTFGSHYLPRAGAWMDDIKRFFGVVMLGVAIWLLDRIVSDSLTLMLYGVTFGLYGIHLGALDPSNDDRSRLKRGIALVLTLYGGALIIGALSGNENPLQPLARSVTATAPATPFVAGTDQTAGAQAGAWQRVQGYENLAQRIAAAQTSEQPVLLDFTADWCVVCKSLEANTLNHPDVLDALSDIALIQVDVTAINADNQRIMAEYGVLGLPTLAFYQADGSEINNARVLGDMSPQNFLSHLNQRVFPHISR